MQGGRGRHQIVNYSFLSYDPYQGKLLRVAGLAVGKKYGNSQNKLTTIGPNVPTYMKSMIHCQVTYGKRHSVAYT